MGGRVVFGSLSVLAILLSGCATTGGDEPPVSLPPEAVTESPGLPCDVPLGTGTSANLRELQLYPLEDTQHGEVDAMTVGNETYVLLARYAAGGFDLVRATDPSHAVPLSGYQPETSGPALDAKFMDERTVILSDGDALELVDVTYPDDPVLDLRYPLEGPSAHMVTPFKVGTRQFAAITEAEGKDISIFEVKGATGDRSMERIARPTLTPLATVTTDSSGATGVGRTHDTWFELDPDGTPLLWVADSFYGVSAFDVSDPASPVVVFTLHPTDPFVGYVHTVRVAHVDGHRLVVASHEYGVPALKVWDATDLASPRLVGTWQMDLPTKPQHNLQVVGSRAYLAQFADGLFVFDLTGVAATGTVTTRLVPMAHLDSYGQDEEPRVPLSVVQSYYGVRDVVLHRGILWTSETFQGLRATQFGCLTPGDPMASSHG